jgi:GNAT superfamily N-acetyltransferase
MEIVPLTQELIPSAQRLVDRVFPHQSLSEQWSLWAYEHKRSLLIRLGLPLFGVKDLTAFWGAVEAGSTEVIAITGLYSCFKDADEAVWLGWFCVAPQRRGAGIGGMMLDFAIERARETGKGYLRLYTSDSPDQAVAQQLYEKKGFALVKVRKRRPYNRIYREKLLE